ncbi:putative zinc finger CCCH domain-containing protein 58-like [Capsicum annuum]|nr:putative zinc finger CCCH domain-containing protein 58-like [Capsicum annuum]
MLLCATLQFTPEEISRTANDINYDLFTKFQFSQSPQPRPPFEKDWDEEEELLTNARSVSRTDYQADPYHNYSGEVIKYIYALGEYTGEAGICPTKPPIAQHLPKGFMRVSRKRIHCQLSRSLMDDTCPVCYAAFEDKNEVIITNCLHEFHIHCLQTWLSKKNACPSCRAVYPLHYSPLFNCRKRRPHHNILEEPHHNILKEPNGSRHQHNISEETNSKRHKHNILEPSV